MSSGIEAALAASLSAPNVNRVFGIDRYATSAAIAMNAFTSAKSVYIATGENFPDALGGSALAGHADSPLFTVPGTCLPKQTLADFDALGVTRVTLIGGAGVVSPSIATLAPCSGGPDPTAVMPISIATTSPQSGPPFLGLEAVDCLSATSCVAVGEVNAHPMFATMTKDLWSTKIESLPSDSNGKSNGFMFSKVSCASASSCAAIGRYKNTSGKEVGLLETLSGTSWTAKEIGLPNPTSDYAGVAFNSVSCGAIGSCIAVGDFEGAPGNSDVGLVLALTGDTWRQLPPAVNQPDGSDVSLTSVSCTSASWCVAVGQPVSGSGSVIETFTSGVGDDQVLSNPNLWLGSVSCAQEGICTAAGIMGSSTNEPVVLETLTDGTWVLSQIAPPSTSFGTKVPNDSISCTTGNFCATYAYDGLDSGKPGLLLVVTGNGTNAASAALLPGGAHGHIGLSGVSCGAPGSCMAVREYVDPTHDHYTYGLIETFSDGVWRATGVPVPKGETWVDETSLTGVSCTEAANCETVGWRNYVNDHHRALYAGIAQTFRP